VLSEGAASAGVPTVLIAPTVKAAGLLAAGPAVVTGVISTQVAALTEGVVKAMLLTKLKTITAVSAIALALGVAGTGVGSLAIPAAAAGRQAAPRGGPELPAAGPLDRLVSIGW
jgi:hypothetical protein